MPGESSSCDAARRKRHGQAGSFAGRGGKVSGEAAAAVMMSMGGGDQDNRSVEEEWPFHKSR